jgi:hypothetical protein
MSFTQFLTVTSLQNNQTKYFVLSHDWKEKREQLFVFIRDIPELIKQMDQISSQSFSDNPRVEIYDSTFRLRVSSACESAAHCLYSMAEISAQFANKATKGDFPSSFNDIVKKLEKSWNPHNIKDILGDFHWYKKIREMRTEWTHYSTIFIAGDVGNHTIVLKRHRRESDQQEFKENNIKIQINDFLLWLNKAIEVLDSFSLFLSKEYLLKTFDLDQVIIVPKRDSRGFPIFLSGPTPRVETENITIGDYFRRAGIKL